MSTVPERLSESALRLSGGSCGDAPPDPAPRPPRRERDEPGYERWLARQTERLDPVMAFLGILFTLIVAFQLADPQLSEPWADGFDAAVWALWGVFVIDFLAKLVAAPSALRFLRRHWLTVVMLLVPTLRLLRFAALIRLGRGLPAARVVTTSYRAAGVARTLLRSRTSFLAAATAVATLAVAQLAWLTERGRDTFGTFGDALLWAAGAVVGSQGDPVPETGTGRLLMIGAFALGLVVVATLAGTVGAFLLEDQRERADGPPAERPTAG